MHFVDDEHAIFAEGRGHHHLLDEGFDVLDAVVRGGVQLDDVHGVAVVESAARGTFIACFAVFAGVKTVDALGKYSCAGCFAYTSRAAEEVGMGQAVGSDSVFKGRC